MRESNPGIGRAGGTSCPERLPATTVPGMKSCARAYIQPEFCTRARTSQYTPIPEISV